MKKSIISFLLFCFALSGFAGIQLDDGRNSSDGFCVMSVMAMQSNQVTLDQNHPLISKVHKTFLSQVKSIAIESYLEYMGDFAENVTSKDLNVKIKFNKFGQRQSRLDTFGAVVEVDMSADEDLVTFYFEMEEDSGRAKMLMALHDEQSATAFWVCQY